MQPSLECVSPPTEGDSWLDSMQRIRDLGTFSLKQFVFFKTLLSVLRDPHGIGARRIDP